MQRDRKFISPTICSILADPSFEVSLGRITAQYFTLPHTFHLDPGGVVGIQWIPADSTWIPPGSGRNPGGIQVEW
jgi:hypothetical protein